MIVIHKVLERGPAHGLSYRWIPMRSSKPSETPIGPVRGTARGPVPALIRAAGALADGNRVRIVRALASGELCVCELCSVLDLTQSTLSTHLGVLRDAGLTLSRRQGKWSYHRLTPLGSSLTEAFFGCFVSALAADARLRRDRRHLERRLAQREAEDCCGAADNRPAAARSSARMRKGRL